MLCINLVPEHARKTDRSSLQQFHRTPLMWIVGTLMVGSAVILLIGVQVRNFQLKRLNEQMQGLQPKKMVVDQLQKFVQTLQEEQSAFERLRQRDTAWATRLMVLAELIPEGVWFTDFVWDPSEGIRVEGMTMQQEGVEMGKISRFMEALQKHASFGPSLTDVKIDSVQRMQDQEIELVKFVITGKLLSQSKP